MKEFIEFTTINDRRVFISAHEISAIAEYDENNCSLILNANPNSLIVKGSAQDTLALLAGFGVAKKIG